MKRLFVFLFPVVLFSGCFINRSMIGTYRNIEGYGVEQELHIKDNGMFTYNWIEGLNKGTTNGTWKNEDSGLILNGGTKQPEQKIIVQENTQASSDSIYIEVMSFEGEPLGKVSVVLNDKIGVVGDLEGKIIIDKIPIKKIKVNYLGMHIPEYQVKNSSANHFIIKVYLTLTQNAYFENTRIQIRGKKLIMQEPSLTGRKITLKKIE